MKQQRLHANTPVVVKNEKLDHHGEAGLVFAENVNDEPHVEVKLDLSGEVFEFDLADIEPIRA